MNLVSRIAGAARLLAMGKLGPSAGFDGAQMQRRLVAWRAGGDSINSLIQQGGELQRARARQLIRSNPYASNAAASFAAHLFTEFGVTAHTEVDFDLDNASPAPGAVKKKCHDIRRKIEDELGVVPYDHIHAMCGPDFFDDLITHPEVEKAYERWLDGAFLRQGQARGSFEYAGILFEEYRGKVGSVDFTDASKAYFFPVGVPGLFRQYNAPADFVETANTIGLPCYAKQAVDQQFARWVMLHVQSNPLPICTRPRALLKGKRT